MAKRKPTPKPLPRQAPKPAPIDLVRNPNFPAALAQQEYQNSIADFRARMLAEQNAADAMGVKYIATMGTSKPMQTEGNPDFIDRGKFERDTRDRGPQYLDRYGFRKRDPRNPNTQYGGPAPELKLPPQLPQEGGGMGGGIPSPIPEGSQVGGGQGNYQFVDPQSPQGQAMQGYQQSLRDALSRYNPNAPSLMPIEIGGSMSGGTGDPRFIYNNLPYISQVGSVPVRNTTGIGGQQFGQIPQQQMQNYQNFLQQGMQNSNTMNQGAMNNFANMQPGMQATQTASTTTPNQTMPVAGMGMQQPKQTPPRKFSTVSNSPARFG